MSESWQMQIGAFKELGKMLTPDDVKKLQNAISIPARIRNETGTNATLFLNSLKRWNQFDPKIFEMALVSLGNQSIMHNVKQIDWLSKSHSKTKASEQPKSVKTLVELLTNEITVEDWVGLTSMSSEVSVVGNEEPKEILRFCIDNEIITRNMKDLSKSLELLERNDLANQIHCYMPVFQNMSKEEFKVQFHNEIEGDNSGDKANWEFCLRKYMKTHNKNVNVVLDEASVPIASVFTPLTVIKVKPAEEKVKEESGINEIEFLRNIHEQVDHQTVEVVDFESIVTTCSDNSVWCMIGNPGSGKSFMCKHFAYSYGIHSLRNFRYALAIPCRSQDWHQLEETRHEGGKDIDEEFIHSWLRLSMSFGAKWSKSLSQHLLKSDGEGLFLILDGVDEFTKNVPFPSTLLSKLLERRFLVSSSILVTSRPSAWSDLMFNHGNELIIDGNFQVLGFSPENRDLYFSKRMTSIDKLKAVHEMFYRHEEISQLALVPVNASLFSSLFNESESILTNTLSHVYTQLVVYIIRRQLSRMGQKEHSKVRQMSLFHPGIKECVHAIAREANQGVFERELTSDKFIPLKIDSKSLASERLGLMQAHIKVDSLGHRVKVWTFQHLTIQEYMAAVSICDNPWPNQCFIVRYIISSVQYLAMYTMVVRFVCGILRRDAGRMTPILCRHTLPQPMSLSEVPMVYQLGYLLDIVEASGWEEFNKSFLLLCTVICEMNSVSVSEHFAYFLEQFPYPLYLYFHSTFSPNEWHCWMQALQYVHEFNVIFIHSGFVSAKQFHSLLTRLYSCHLDHLALVFVEKDFDSILSYTGLLSSEALPANTRISIELLSCDLSAYHSSQLLFPSTNQFSGSLMLHQSPMNPPMLQNLTNQFTSLQNLYYSPKSDDSDWPIIHQLITDDPLNGLYIRDFYGYLPATPDSLSALSSLKELYWITEPDCYEALAYLDRLSSLTFLYLHSGSFPSPNPSYLDSVTQLIRANSTSLREISLIDLDRIGFTSWSSCFELVSICPNLITLQLSYCNFTPNDISCWYKALTVMKSLVYLRLAYTPLQDAGMLVLCHSLNYHPAIRRIWIKKCSLSSASCLPIKYLILTPPHLRMLDLSRKELSRPNPEQLDLLVKAAEECSIEITFWD